jgi:hypothetical protein
MESKSKKMTFTALSSPQVVACKTTRVNAPCARTRVALRAPRRGSIRTSASSPTLSPNSTPVDETSVLDSVIVGGGISGLTTALVCAARLCRSRVACLRYSSMRLALLS